MVYGHGIKISDTTYVVSTYVVYDFSLLRQSWRGISMTSLLLLDGATWCHGSVGVKSSRRHGKIGVWNSRIKSCFLVVFVALDKYKTTLVWFLREQKHTRKHTRDGLWPGNPGPKTITRMFLLPQKPHSCGFNIKMTPVWFLSVQNTMSDVFGQRPSVLCLSYTKLFAKKDNFKLKICGNSPAVGAMTLCSQWPRQWHLMSSMHGKRRASGNRWRHARRNPGSSQCEILEGDPEKYQPPWRNAFTLCGIW
jgi:hypothetical protein